MGIPTEPIGSIPRPQALIEGMHAFQIGNMAEATLQQLFDAAVKETIELFEATGSPVITDGEQTKPSFVTYPIHGADYLAMGGVTIPFADGHTRQLPKLAKGPFRYTTYADSFLKPAKKIAKVPVKQAVISASAMSLLYPGEGIAGYSQDAFISDLIREAVSDIRRSLDAGAYNVQIDFTEARLSIKLDPSKGLLKNFVALNNKVLSHFSAAEKKKLGVHTCPGGDHDSTHSADVDYAELLPDLFAMDVGNFYIQLASEKNRAAVLNVIKKHARPEHKIFVGVTDPISPTVETPEQVCAQLLEAAKFIPTSQLGSTDDCGFSPFADDTSTARDLAFAKIRARIEGTKLASRELRV